MQSKLIKFTFFASLVCLAGVILTPDALGADTLVYAIVGGTQTLGRSISIPGFYANFHGCRERLRIGCVRWRPLWCKPPVWLPLSAQYVYRRPHFGADLFPAKWKWLRCVQRLWLHCRWPVCDGGKPFPAASITLVRHPATGVPTLIGSTA